MENNRKKKKAKTKWPPRHPDLKYLLPSLGPVKKPESLEEALMDFIDSEFMFGGFPEFEPAVMRVIEILAEYDIDPRSKNGQQLLSEFINHAEEEYYGDFERFTECSTCGEKFLPEYNLDYVFKIVSRRVTCPKCGRNPEDKPA